MRSTCSLENHTGYFESSEPGSRDENKTDKRFFWLSLYATPAIWVVFGILAMVRVSPIWIVEVGK